VGAREDRIGLNEAVFREVNERIEGLAETFDLMSAPLDLVCECGEATCVERITMSHPEYEQLRSDAHLFAVYPGHEVPDIERVVDRQKSYYVVEKDVGVPERIAEQTDPRS
jgi:hypothetical protein